MAANPGLVIPEVDGGNNSRIVSVGGIAAPVGLWAQVEPGSLAVHNWRGPQRNRRLGG